MDDDEIVVIVCHWCGVDCGPVPCWTSLQLAEVPESLQHLGIELEITVPVCREHYEFESDVWRTLNLLFS
jgi:hypothetical protein